MNEWIAAGDWTLYYGIEDATKKLTVADLKRVANQYLNLDDSTTGWFVPIVPGGKEQE